MQLSPVQTYLSDLHAVSGVGVPETSGYPALSNLLNAVGDSLKPKIFTVINPANKGAGIPDGGLFSKRDLSCRLTLNRRLLHSEHRRVSNR